MLTKVEITMNIFIEKNLDLDVQQGMNTRIVSQVTCDIDTFLPKFFAESAEKDDDHVMSQGKRRRNGLIIIIIRSW